TTCTAAGITVTNHTPVLSLCRRLLGAGHDPKTRLEVYRGTTLALIVRSIGEAAQLTIKTAGNGNPVFAREPQAEGVTASPLRESGSALLAGWTDWPAATDEDGLDIPEFLRRSAS